MSPTALGRIVNRDPREVWRNEERDFTPWLAENIGLVSDVLGIPIAVDQIEHRVGPYELDILGHVETTDAVVIVENQLTRTDHGHLGQLITYAAGLEAAVVIWIAVDVCDEHKAAIDWLNQHAAQSISFFLLRPEVFSIDDSPPAVRLNLVAAPSEFSRRLRSVVESEERPSHEFRRQFWSALLAHLATKGHAWARGRATTKDAWIAFGVGRTGIGCHVSMAQGSRIRVEIYLSDERAKRRFDQLHAHRPDIEAELTPDTVSWERLEDAVAARVAVYRDYDKSAVSDATAERRALFDWIESRLCVMRAVAKRYLVDQDVP